MTNQNAKGAAKHGSSNGVRQSSRVRAQKQNDKAPVQRNSDPSSEPERAATIETAGGDQMVSPPRREKRNNDSEREGHRDAKRRSPRLQIQEKRGMASGAKKSNKPTGLGQAAGMETANIPQSSNSYHQPSSAELQIAGSPQYSHDDESQLQGDDGSEQLEDDAPTSKPQNGEIPSHMAGMFALVAEQPPVFIQEPSSPTMTTRASSSTSPTHPGSHSDISVLNETQEESGPHMEGAVNGLAPLEPQQASNAIVSQERGLQRITYQELTVELGYITDPERTVEREEWYQRQDPESRDAHLFGRLFVNSTRELYFIQFDIEIGVKQIAWLVNKDQQRLRVIEDAYRAALKQNPRLGGHLFYGRCDGAWEVADLPLDVQPPHC